MSTNLKTIQMYNNKFLLIFVFTLLSYSYASAQTYITALTVEDVSSSNVNNQPLQSIEELVIVTSNVLSIDATAHQDDEAYRGENGEYYWSLRVDLDNDGIYDETVMSAFYTEQEPRLNKIILLSDQIMAALGNGIVKFRLSVGNSSIVNTGDDGTDFNTSGPIKVGNTADASGIDNFCLSRRKSSMTEIFIENRSNQSISSSDISLHINAPYFYRIVSGLPTTLAPETTYALTLAFNKKFGDFGQEQVNVNVSYTFDQMSGISLPGEGNNSFTGNKVYSFDVCSGGFSVRPSKSNQISSLVTIAPNPFYHSTNINYTIDKAGSTQIILYNSVGQQIKTLLNHTFQELGKYSIELEGNDLKPGLYFIQIKVGDDITVKQVIKQQ